MVGSGRGGNSLHKEHPSIQKEMARLKYLTVFLLWGSMLRILFSFAMPVLLSLFFRGRLMLAHWSHSQVHQSKFICSVNWLCLRVPLGFRRLPTPSMALQRTRAVNEQTCSLTGSGGRSGRETGSKVGNGEHLSQGTGSEVGTPGLHKCGGVWDVQNVRTLWTLLRAARQLSLHCYLV